MPEPALQEAADQRSPTPLALHSSEWQFRRLLEKLPAGAYTCDPEGLITYCNQQAVQLWGRAPKLNDPEDRFCGSFKLFSTDGSPIAHDQCWMALALKMDKAYNGHEIVIERPDGERLTALAHANPIHDESGKLLGAVNVLVDITERKRAEDALREADRRKDEFLAMLAHELRNPLAPLSNALAIIKQTSGNGELIEQILPLMERQLAQLVRLVDDLLNVSRITRNKLQLRKEPVELTAVIQSAVETSRPLIEAMGHALTVSLPSALVHLEADLTRLAQVFLNLLNNAAKYSERGGHIWLTAECQATQVIVRVRDTGIGIPADRLASIFEMFTQVDCALEQSRGGLGIGLTLVKQLVELHGGTVEAYSEGPGQGSEFVVCLPVLTTRSQPEELLADNPSTPAPKRRLLVVDNNRDAARSLALLLQLTGNEVHTAHDGEEAVAAASALRPQVILLDIGMPKLNGYDAARRIREQPWGKTVVLVAMTGWGQEEDRRRSSTAGFDHHLVKPVDLKALQSLLMSLADSRPNGLTLVVDRKAS